MFRLLQKEDLVICCSEAGDQLLASHDPATTKFSFEDDDVSSSSPQHQSAVRKARESGVSEISKIHGNPVKSSEKPVNVGSRTTHVATKRSARRYARDVSYYDNDEDQRLRDVLEKLASRDGRLGKRQPIDRIDEPSEWRDRLRIMNPRLMIERQPLDRLHRISSSWSSVITQPLDRLARQPLDRIDEPSAWRSRHIPKMKEFYTFGRRT